MQNNDEVISNDIDQIKRDLEKIREKKNENNECHLYKELNSISFRLSLERLNKFYQARSSKDENKVVRN